jgi:hypothetical protein
LPKKKSRFFFSLLFVKIGKISLGRAKLDNGVIGSVQFVADHAVAPACSADTVPFSFAAWMKINDASQIAASHFRS